MGGDGGGLDFVMGIGCAVGFGDVAQAGDGHLPHGTFVYAEQELGRACDDSGGQGEFVSVGCPDDDRLVDGGRDELAKIGHGERKVFGLVAIHHADGRELNSKHFVSTRWSPGPK